MSAAKLGRIHRRNALARLARFRLGDRQQRVEGGEQLVRFIDGALERQPIVALIRGAQRILGARLDAGERRLRSCATLLDTSRIPSISRSIRSSISLKRRRQPVELVAGAGERHALGEVAFHDGSAGFRQPLDPLEEVAAHQQPADEPERQRQRQPADRRVLDDAVEPPPLLDVAPDDQAEAAFELGVVGLGAMPGQRPTLLIGIVELDPAMLARRLDRQSRQIAGEAPPTGLVKM